MTTIVIYIAISVTCLTILGVIDPKRSGQQKARHQQKAVGLKSLLRKTLVLISLLPGIWLLMGLEGAYFLIWFGIVTIAGWLVALLLQTRAG